MIELVEYLVSALVPDGDYTVEQRDGNGATDIVVTISKNDIGKIIGKQGRIAKAIRTLVKSANGKNAVKYNVVIEEKNEI
ncbi:MAG: KH domain-containing protein [Bacteroides sp.]|nr:KH domain-containing protein [Bacillota bacterium]MCM1393704.1 KH domain-containing protein [[Eubacterium] siraeum]MCM1456078.1 KH domain-containing protein [Bacteroides sp.]